MNIDLTFLDLVSLVVNKGKLEKDGATITVGRPVLPKLNINTDGGKVVFSLDEADPRTKQILDQFFQKG
jgi:hypothetical protein